MRRKGALLGTVAAVLLTSGMLSGCGKTEEPAPKAQVASGPRLLLQLSDTTGWHDVPAEIATLKEAQVFARIPGVLTTLAVREGDMVGKGQVIGRIVDNQLGFQAGAYGAQAAAAQAQVVQAEAELKRVQYLYDKGVYAKARLDQAIASLGTAKAQVRAAQAQQSAVAAVAGQGAVVAPSSGRVLRVPVPAGAPVAPGVVVAVITSGPTILRLQVPESLAGQVHPGSRVLTAAFGGGSSEGRVIKVYPSITAGQVTVNGATTPLIPRAVEWGQDGPVLHALLPADAAVTGDGVVCDAPAAVSALAQSFSLRTQPRTRPARALQDNTPHPSRVCPALAQHLAARTCFVTLLAYPP